MKHIFLAAATPLPVIERAIERLNKRQVALKEEPYRYEIAYLKVGGTRTHRFHTSDIVILLGHFALQANHDQIRSDAVAIVMGDPMNLACVEGEGISKLDFKQKEDGLGAYLKQRKPLKVAKKLAKALEAEEGETEVSIKSFDWIPTVINQVQNTVNFAQDFQAIVYHSLRNEIDRDRFRARFISWVLDSKQAVDDFPTYIAEGTALAKSNKRLASIRDTFLETPKIRGIVAGLLSSIESKTAFPYDKAAKSANLSAFDLRYLAQMIRKKPLLLKHINSEVAHMDRVTLRLTQNVEDEDE